jgi:hypothetical protein
MDCKNPSAPTHSASRVPAGNPPNRPARQRPREHARIGGITHQYATRTSHFTMVGNDFAQHRELSGLARGIGLYMQSVASGAPVDIKTLASCFPEGQTRIAAALRELETHGYLRRTPERIPGGRIITRTVFIHCPGAPDSPPPRIPQQRQGLDCHGMPTAQPSATATTTPAEPSAPTAPEAPEEPAEPAEPEDPALYGEPEDLWAPWGLWNDWDARAPWDLSDSEIPTHTSPADSPTPPDPPTATSRTHATTTPVTAPDPAPEDPTTDAPAPDGTPRPPKRPLPPVPQPSQPSPELLRTAADLLAGLRRHNPQLRLSTNEVNHLTPGVAAWLEREVTSTAVRTALTCGLPFPVHCPAALLAYRLIDQLPPPLPPLPPRTAESPHPPAPIRHPVQNCDGCDRGFRSPDPDALCRDCTAERTEHAEHTTRQPAYT